MSTTTIPTSPDSLDLLPKLRTDKEYEDMLTFLLENVRHLNERMDAREAERQVVAQQIQERKKETCAILESLEYRL